MKIICLKYLLVVVEILILTNFSIGQGTFYLGNGCNVNIHAGTAVQMNDLNIGTGNQLVNRGKLTVNGVLANFAGIPGLILRADESGFGSLMHYTPNVPATVEQYLVSERWHLVSPPVTGASIGVYLDIYLKEWSEPTSEWTYLVQPTSMPMNQNQGYSAWASDELTGSTTVTYRGNLKAGNGAFTNLTYTSAAQGWNLVGNPYPSPVEWNTNWTIYHVGGWAIVYENGTFRGWNPWMPSGQQSYNGKTDGFIAPTQAFWIRTTGDSPYVLIPQTARSHSTIPFMKESEISDAQSLHLFVNANGFIDETVIVFMENATNGFDDLFDLEKHLNVDESPNIYSIPFTDKSYAVNVLPSNWLEINEPAAIPLGFKIGPETNCSMTIEGIQTLDTYTSVYLEDLKENILQNLSANNTYIFDASAQDEPNRFLLHFGLPDAIKEDSTKAISIYSNRDCIYINMPLELNGYAGIFDMQGREISSSKIHGGLNKEKLNRTGFYIVKVKTADISTIKKVFIKK